MGALARGLGGCALTALLLGSPARADPASDAGKSTETYASLALQVALLRKMNADEQFIAAGRPTGTAAMAIDQLYAGARDSLKCNESPSDSVEQAAMRKLLCADVDYRRFLLAREVSFWGGTRSLTPEIPRTHLVALGALLRA